MTLASVYTRKAIDQCTPQTTSQVETELRQQIQVLQTVQKTHKLRDPRNSIQKLKNQTQQLAAVVDIWWSWVDSCLESSGCDADVRLWVKQQLLPALYWQQQEKRTKNPDLRRDYQIACQQAFSSLNRHPVTAYLAHQSFQSWLHWASWMVSKFQRCSSSVEGRNGYLSQVYHNRRGLSAGATESHDDHP